MSISNIYWWEGINSPRFACPCYIHTFETGEFIWTNTLVEEGGPISATPDGEIGGCNYFEKTNALEGGHWAIRQIFTDQEEGIWRAESSVVYGDVGTAKDEYIWFAPGFVFLTATTYVIEITLKTSSCAGHKASLVVTSADVSADNTGWPSSAGSADVLALADFDNLVNIGWANDCTGLGTNEFATDGNEVTIMTTFSQSTGSSQVKWLGIRDQSSAPTVAEAESTFTILEVKVSSPSYPTMPNILPTFTATVTADNGTTNGAIAVDNTVSGLANTDCLWCWGDTTANIQADPDRTNLNSGWYGLKIINTATGYTLPVQMIHVPFFKTGNLSSPNNVWTEEVFVKKGNSMYNAIMNGMNSSFLDLMQVDIIKYLWDKNDTDCLTDARKANFEKILLNEFNTCLAPLSPEFQAAYAAGVLNDDSLLANYDIETWSAEALIWNQGVVGKPTGERCCTGKVDYIHPAYVLHNNKIWKSTSSNANTTTEPGSFSGRGNWEEAKKRKSDSRKIDLIHLENLRKKSMFAIEGVEPSGVRALNKYYGTEDGNIKPYIQLENLKILKPEKSGSRKIV